MNGLSNKNNKQHWMGQKKPRIDDTRNDPSSPTISAALASVAGPERIIRLKNQP
jgi:hypothetical protein